MIVCRLELWKGGNPEDVEHLGTIHLTNDLETSLADPRRGTYFVSLWKKRLAGKMWRTKVYDYPRLSYHPWNLVRNALNEIAKKNGGRI